MEKREPRVFYIAGRKRKGIIVFDRGYATGDVHIYEEKDSISTDDIENEVKEYLGVDTLASGTQDMAMRTWVQKKFGFPLSWKLIEE
jgi:outer membrane lipoprotein-sorting protein